MATVGINNSTILMHLFLQLIRGALGRQLLEVWNQPYYDSGTKHGAILLEVFTGGRSNIWIGILIAYYAQALTAISTVRNPISISMATVVCYCEIVVHKYHKFPMDYLARAGIFLRHSVSYSGVFSFVLFWLAIQFVAYICSLLMHGCVCANLLG